MDFVPRPPTGASPLDPTGGLPYSRPPDLGPRAKNFQSRTWLRWYDVFLVWPWPWPDDLDIRTW